MYDQSIGAGQGNEILAGRQGIVSFTGNPAPPLYASNGRTAVTARRLGHSTDAFQPRSAHWLALDLKSIGWSRAEATPTQCSRLAGTQADDVSLR